MSSIVEVDKYELMAEGFDEQEGFSRQGLGLISMRERLQMVHGVLVVKAQPGAGTIISARVPLQTASLRARLDKTVENENGVVYHTYSAYARGVDALWGMWQWLDRAPKGRNETGHWWRRHEEYDKR